jgi:hypothetical protein
VKAELRSVRLDLHDTIIRLLHSRICHQAEAQRSQTLQSGLDAHQQQHFQLARYYRSIYEEYDREKKRLQEDLRLANELIESQKQLIDMYQGQQQQQPASHLVQGGPLLSQCNDPNHSCQYPSYQPTRNQQFVIEPVGLHPLNDFDYSIGSPIEPSCDTDPVMSTPVAQFEEQTPNMSVQSMLHPISAERDAPGPTHTKSDERKRAPGDEGLKPNKKRRTTK